MDIYQNVCSFIRFSNIDPSFKTPPENEIEQLLHNRDPIDFITNKVLVRLYSVDTKRSNMKQILEFTDNSIDRYVKVILIKKNWAASIDNEKVFTYFNDDFIMDIAQINNKFAPRIMSREEVASNLGFYNIPEQSLPVIFEDNILTKWLLGKKDDLLIYHIDTENGRYLSIRVVKGLRPK